MASADSDAPAAPDSTGSEPVPARMSPIMMQMGGRRAEAEQARRPVPGQLVESWAEDMPEPDGAWPCSLEGPQAGAWGGRVAESRHVSGIKRPFHTEARAGATGRGEIGAWDDFPACAAPMGGTGAGDVDPFHDDWPLWRGLDRVLAPSFQGEEVVNVAGRDINGLNHSGLGLGASGLWLG